MAEQQRTLAGKTLFITGASRGIGLEIGLAAARQGANVAIAAKSVEAHRYLPGTIYSAAEAINAAGGRGLPIMMDVRNDQMVMDAVAQTVAEFGGIDVCVNNASAIDQSNTLQTEMKRFDLLHDVIYRGTFLVSKTCLPHLLKADNPHILMLSPPPVVDKTRLARSLHNTIAKHCASLCVVGMSEEFREQGVAVNALRPRTWIATSAIEFRRGAEAMQNCRSPRIMGDAACEIFNRPSREFTGHFVVDDEVLYEGGVRDFDQYRMHPTAPLHGSGMSKLADAPPYLKGVIDPPGAMGEALPASAVPRR